MQLNFIKKIMFSNGWLSDNRDRNTNWSFQEVDVFSNGLYQVFSKVYLKKWNS